MSASCLDRNLLADNGSDNQLMRVDRAWHPDSRGAKNTRSQCGVFLQRCIDGAGVGVQIQEASYPGDCSSLIAQIREFKLSSQGPAFGSMIACDKSNGGGPTWEYE